MPRHAAGEEHDVVTNSRSTLLGWGVLGAVCALLPLQAAWFVLMDSEPYPALSQPAFHIIVGADGEFNGQSTSLTVITKSGSTVEVPADAVFANTGNQRPYIVSALAASPRLDFRSRAEVLSQLSDFVPVDDIQALQIDVRKSSYRPDDNTRTTSPTTTRTVLDLTDRAG